MAYQIPYPYPHMKSLFSRFKGCCTQFLTHLAVQFHDNFHNLSTESVPLQRCQISRDHDLTCPAMLL